MKHVKRLLIVAACTLIIKPLNAQTSSQATFVPGDVIRLQVWREPDLNGDFVVDERGQVVLPLLGSRKVEGLVFSAVRDSLLSEYSRQLKNPSVTVTPLRRIYVLGEVNKPGLYLVDPTISLAGAVALAGGPTPSGDIHALRIIRNGIRLSGTGGVTAETALSTVDVRSEDQLFVDRRGWFDRNSTFAVSALLSVTTIIVTLLR